ncbi:LADA_0B05446g1_1 [Lachancea dasiensis]|uniref:LADA_0B05446g1_1 n=1 Tax=Lachancea dasiensis TaxID=1072105 RepID=A0A1G4ITF8_9SACH|nr:LADA_0B05446g1_1 [Lachancea dasiensis]
MSSVDSNPNFSLTDLIDRDLRFHKLKEKLSEHNQNSKEYLTALYNAMPLSGHVDYPVFLEQQAVPVPGSRRPGYSPTYRNALSPDHLVSSISPRLATFFDIFNFTTERCPENDCLGARVKLDETAKWGSKYVFETYSAIQERSRNLGSGIMTLVNFKRKQAANCNDFIVSLLSTNRKEWIISDLACQAYSLPNTALYETLGPDTSQYILNITNSPVLILSKSNLYKVLAILSNLNDLSTLICMDDLSSDELAHLNGPLLAGSINQRGERVSVLTFKQVEEIGFDNQVPIIPPTADSLYTISFTSGTTGTPKGVLLNQSHLMAGVTFLLSNIGIPPTKNGKQPYDMCFLPLAHIFERMIAAYELAVGAALGFLHVADPAVLIEDLRVLKPDFFCVVPRVLTKLEAGIKNAVQGATVPNFTKLVARKVLDKRLVTIQSREGPDNSILNHLVYRKILIDKIRASVGLSEASFIVIGSAPISSDTLMFMKSALDCGVRQGYGLTETFAGVCLSEPHERDSGTCGAIAITTECRLRSVPEMGYDAEHDLRGEVQVRGSQVFAGYFKNPDTTKEVLDGEGWFSTGDIGYIDSRGRLSIIDRVKNFFKLAQGEYIAPEKIENIYISSCPYLTQICVYGDPLKTFLVAIVGLDLEAITSFLHQAVPGLRIFHGENLINALNDKPEYRKELLKMMNSFVRGLQGFERVNNIYVGVEPLKVSDDTITPTLKVKRAKATKKYENVLKALYEEGSLIKAEKL